LILFRFLISPKSRQRDRKAIGDRRDVGVNGRREIPGMDIGPSVAETLRTAFFAQACPVAATRGGSPPALMGASRPPSAKVLNANRQRCRMRLMRQCPADAARAAGASSPPSSPRHSPGTMPTNMIADMSFQAQHRAKLHSADPIERLDGETRRTKMSRDRDKTIIRLKDADVRRSCLS